jgi:hypothetical protein
MWQQAKEQPQNQTTFENAKTKRKFKHRQTGKQKLNMDKIE